MAKCTKCGAKTKFMMSLCDACIDASSGSYSAEPIAATHTDDIGYLLGWFCWIPPVALIAAIVFLCKRRWRKAFQAIAITVIYMICINIVQLAVRRGGSDAVTFIIINILTVVAVPLIAGVRLF